MTLLVLGVASFAGTTAAAPLLRWNLRIVLAVLAAAQAALAGLLLLLGTSQIAVFVLIAVWGFAAGGLVIDTSGITGPLIVSGMILAVAALHTARALGPTRT